MKYVYDDGGRQAAGFRGRAGDCVTRAIAITSGRPYREVYDALSEGSRTQRLTKHSTRRKPSARDGVSTRRAWFRRYMEEAGFEWCATMGIGTGCRVHLVDGELPAGRLVVKIAKHLTAVIDGVIHDTWDPRIVWEAGRPCVVPRCVYGYWWKLDSSL